MSSFEQPRKIKRMVRVNEDDPVLSVEVRFVQDNWVVDIQSLILGRVIEGNYLTGEGVKSVFEDVIECLQREKEFAIQDQNNFIEMLKREAKGKKTN